WSCSKLACLVEEMNPIGKYPLLYPVLFLILSEYGDGVRDGFLFLPVPPLLSPLCEALKGRSRRFADRSRRHILHGRSRKGHEGMAVDADLRANPAQPLHQLLAQQLIL